jgi:DNA-binding NarL/FixJ family response regulator
MAIRPDSPLGRAVLASRFKPPLVRITLPPRLANFLIAAGAQSSSSDDRMSVEFKPRQGEPDPSPGQDPDRGSVADPSSEDSGARPGDPSRAEEDRWQAIAAGLLDVITDAKLTPQEGKLATLLTRGYGVSAISRELGLTDILTDSLLIGLLRKLDLSSRSAGLSAYALSYWESRQNSAVVAAWWEQVLSFRATDRAKLAELLARPDLTPQEREIVTLLAKGRGFQAIARELGISLRAAKTHGREIYAKLSPDRYRRVQAGEARRRPRDPLVE